METLDTLLAHARARPAELLKARQNGTRIIGYTPGGYFPEELAYALGVIPGALLRGGDHEAVIASGPYLARFLDTFCRAQIGYRMLGDEPIYQMIDLLVAVVADNHMRAVAESWEMWTEVEVLKLAVPSNKTRHGFEYYLDAINRLKEKLEEITGTKLDYRRLKEELELFNKVRSLISCLKKKEKHGTMF